MTIKSSFLSFSSLQYQYKNIFHPLYSKRDYFLRWFDFAARTPARCNITTSNSISALEQLLKTDLHKTNYFHT